MNEHPTELQAEVQDLVAESGGLMISTQEDLDVATTYVSRIKKAIKKAKEFFDVMKAPAKSTLEAIREQEQKLIAPLLAEEEATKKKMTDWFDNQKRIAYAAQQKAAAEAKRQADEDAAARAAALKANRPVPPPREFSPAPVPAAAAPTISGGSSMRSIWYARVDNPALLPDEYWVIDQVKLDKLAKATSGAMVIPGVTMYDKTVASVRSA